jgi:hypothetical protein
MNSVEEYARRGTKSEGEELDTLSEWIKSIRKLLKPRIVREPNPYFPLNLELRVKVFFSADSGTLRVTFHHPSG